MTPAPTPSFFIERLDRSHRLEAFDCGNPPLNDWLSRYAWTNHQADSARTYVAVESGRVAGYYALTTGSVLKHESPSRVAKGLANHPVGVVVLARLAVGQSFHGVGLGKASLFDALSRVATWTGPQG